MDHTQTITHTHQGLDDSLSAAAAQRAKALALQQRLQQTSERLQQGKQQLAEAEVRQEQARASACSAACVTRPETPQF